MNTGIIILITLTRVGIGWLAGFAFSKRFENSFWQKAYDDQLKKRKNETRWWFTREREWLKLVRIAKSEYNVPDPIDGGDPAVLKEDITITTWD